MNRLKRLAIVLSVVLVGTFALFGIRTLTRGTPVRMVVGDGTAEGGPPAVDDSIFEQTIELYTAAHVYPGNAVEPLLNGDGTYPRLWSDLRSAREAITVQMYYSMPGAVADSLSAVLRERARSKVRVLLLLDAFGSQKLKKSWVDELTAAGVRVAVFRKLRWYTLNAAVNRSHARVVVIDGRIAYTGGFGLADYWLGDGLHDEQWRETNVRFEGPAVMALQAAFTAAWAEATGELLAGSMYFPAVGFQPRGSIRAGLLFARPTNGSTVAEQFIALSISGSRRSLYISNSYFVPDDDQRRMLLAAARRGVDVRVLTVSGKTDVKTTWYAGRHYYADLLKGGVRIYEYLPTMMHAKTMIVDGRWGTIGSMNFDNRSVAFNDETNLVFLDAGLGATMDSMFMQDLRHSIEIRADEFERRGGWRKLLERGAALMQRIL
jgi:cardiolipin synthase